MCAVDGVVLSGMSKTLQSDETQEIMSKLYGFVIFWALGEHKMDYLKSS